MHNMATEIVEISLRTRIKSYEALNLSKPCCAIPKILQVPAVLTSTNVTLMLVILDWQLVELRMDFLDRGAREETIAGVHDDF